MDRKQPEVMFRIFNVNDQMTVHHKLILLAAQLYSNENNVIDFVKICSSGDSNNPTKWPVYNNDVRALCYLVKGENRIEIYDGSNKLLSEITIFYEPEKQEYVLEPIFIICDGEEGTFYSPPNFNNSVTSACARISLAAEMLQSFYAESLYQSFGTLKTFALPYDSSGKVKCRVFYSKLKVTKALSMTDRELWINFAQELTASNYSPKTKFLAFLACTQYNVDKKETIPLNHKESLSFTRGYASLGSGGLALIGTPCLFTWPENLSEVVEKVCDETVVDRLLVFDDSANRGTYSGCYSTGLGTVCHELGHLFELAHTDGGIMGRGFDDISHAFVSHQKKPLTGDSVLTPSLVWNNDARDACKKLIATKKTDESLLKYWNLSSLNILNYHRWFNQATEFTRSSFKITRKTVFCENPLAVIELRNKIGSVLHQWTFKSNDGIKKWNFPLKYCNKTRNSNVLFVTDVYGNTFKTDCNQFLTTEV